MEKPQTAPYSRQEYSHTHNFWNTFFIYIFHMFCYINLAEKLKNCIIVEQVI